MFLLDFWPLFPNLIVHTLAPGPFPPPVFDCLQYGNKDGKGLEKESRVWHQIDMRGWCPVVIIPKLCDDQPWVHWTTNCIDTVFQTLPSQVLGQDIKRRTLGFLVGHRPPQVYPHVYLTSHTWFFFQVLPLGFCKLQAIKNWKREWSGNEAKPSMHEQSMNHISLKDRSRCYAKSPTARRHFGPLI